MTAWNLRAAIETDAAGTAEADPGLTPACELKSGAGFICGSSGAMSFQSRTWGLHARRAFRRRCCREGLGPRRSSGTSGFEILSIPRHWKIAQSLLYGVRSILNRFRNRAHGQSVVKVDHRPREICGFRPSSRLIRIQIHPAIFFPIDSA